MSWIGIKYVKHYISTEINSTKIKECHLIKDVIAKVRSVAILLLQQIFGGYKMVTCKYGEQNTRTVGVLYV